MTHLMLATNTAWITTASRWLVHGASRSCARLAVGGSIVVVARACARNESREPRQLTVERAT
jgi:hypothetical protein